MNYVHTGAEAVKTNKALNYSKSLLPIFSAHDIKLLKSLHSIDKNAYGIKKGEVCQLHINPAGQVSVGYFMPHGSGTSYHQFDTTNPFKENVDFVFV